MAVRGLRFVLTGKMTRVRPEMEALIEAGGGYVSNKVDRYTNYVVCGKRVGNNKFNDAERFGVSLITENELWRMINEENHRPRPVTRDQIFRYTHDANFNEPSLYSTTSTAAVPTETVQFEDERPAPAPTPEVVNPVVGFSISEFFDEDDE